MPKIVVDKNELMVIREKIDSCCKLEAVILEFHH